MSQAGPDHCSGDTHSVKVRLCHIHSDAVGARDWGRPEGVVVRDHAHKVRANARGGPSCTESVLLDGLAVWCQRIGEDARVGALSAKGVLIEYDISFPIEESTPPRRDGQRRLVVDVRRASRSVKDGTGERRGGVHGELPREGGGEEGVVGGPDGDVVVRVVAGEGRAREPGGRGGEGVECSTAVVESVTVALWS